MKRSKSSHQWLKNHEDDPWVKRARAEGFRSRASYKLMQIDDKFNLLKPGMCVVDLGAAPGGWSQVAAKRVGSGGKVIALDILPVDPIDGVTIIEGDFTTEEVLKRLLDEIGSSSVDLVISDMAPNLSGMKAIDQPRSVYLVELAIELVDLVLRKKGVMVSKCFEGEGINDIRKAYRERFARVSNFKPRSSSGKSREIYVVGFDHLEDPQPREI